VFLSFLGCTTTTTIDDHVYICNVCIGAVVTGASRTAGRSTAWLVISSTPSS
jgi:hypothetical protein